MASPSPPAKRRRHQEETVATLVQVPWEALLESPARFADVLQRHHYVILKGVPHRVSTACGAAAAAMARFFTETSVAAKQELVCSHPPKRCGYRITTKREGVSEDCRRESYNVRGDVGPLQPWPSRSTAVVVAECARQLEEVAHRCLRAALRGAEPPSQQMLDELGLGPSVLDAFHYLGSGGTCGHGGRKVLMYEHLDPGFFTIEPRASAAGLEVFEGSEGKWRLIEPELGPHDLVVLASETMQRVTQGTIKGSMHRVVGSGEQRFSMAFEMRSLQRSCFQISHEILC